MQAEASAPAVARPGAASEAPRPELELDDAERGRVDRLERAERSTRGEEGES